MTEYWVSKQSYFCKYCDIFIRDDKPSRAQHENGLRHKGNLERYIRDIYKKEDRANKERADEASQVSKIEKAARLAHEQQDLSDGQGENKEKDDAEGRGDEPHKRTKYDKQDWKGAENLQNYSDARSLGFIPEEEVEAAARAEEEKEARSKEGRVGKWEAVVKMQPHNGAPSGLKAATRGKITSQLTNDRDPDKKPHRKLFSERNLEADTETLEWMEIKVKVDRRLNSQKQEDGQHSADLHGSIQPIRLDGLRRNPLDHIKAENPSPQAAEVLKSDVDQEEDIKPNTEEMKPPIETPVLFKKRKATQAQPRQRT